ncbi:MAG TPA: ECF transporter S component [Candidatus Dormibacteraeota bacterium]|nr:ECF transporter S component [Candidatus Dormibacteraeota bacterium]
MIGILRRHSEDAALIVISVAGLAAFLLPLGAGTASGQSAALFAGLLTVSAIVVIGLALQTHRLSARLVAILAALVAVDATLRLVLVIGLLGFSPIFFLIIVAGYIMGPGFGFAMGAMTLLLSSFITAGFGPWLPYQMLGSAWAGMGAGYVGLLASQRTSRGSIVLLAIYGMVAGFAYGILLDLWEWPAILGAGVSPIGWAPGLPLFSMLKRFGTFYLATSAVYDAFRAAGNCLLVLLLGPAVATALQRFKRRFLVEWRGPVKLPDDARSPA